MTTDRRDPDGYDPEGLRVRREVLGDAHVDASLAAADEFTGEFQRFITHYAWGGVWSRPGLDRRTRSMLTLTALATLRAEGELALHIRAALRNGLTPDEIREVLLHVAVYAGVPAANSAFALAARVLREEGALPPATPRESPPSADRESPPAPDHNGAGAS